MPAPVVSVDDDTPIQEHLSYPIHLSERVKKSAAEATSFKLECSDLAKHVHLLSDMLRTAVRLSNSTAAAAGASSCVYDRPIRRVSAEVSRNLQRALTLARKCRRRNFFRRVVNIVTAADFRKLFCFLDASIADLRWLLSVIDRDTAGGGIVLSLPPIASNDPLLAWIWSFISVVQTGLLSDRIEAASELASLAIDSDRNKKMIAEEGGIPPLLKLLKEDSSPEAQIAAATTLYSITNDNERANLIVRHLGVPLIVQVLQNSPIRVQTLVAKLVARMSEVNPIAREEFARENAIRPLVSLLSLDSFGDSDQNLQSKFAAEARQSIHSIVQINKQLGKKMDSISNSRFASFPSFQSDSGSSRGSALSKKERENESSEVKHQLKINCAEALWMLANGSILNSTRITETKGLLCLAKLVENENGELQKNCLMALMEISTAAELNSDLRRSAFKANSPAAKAVVAQLLGVISNPTHDPQIQIPAIRSLGSLARTFPARETRVIEPLVRGLSHPDQEVAAESAIALGKFAGPENYLCKEHSRSIVEFNGVVSLIRLLRGGERVRGNALVVLCFLAIHAGESEGLQEARALAVLEAAEEGAAVPELKELVAKAVYHLRMYHAGIALDEWCYLG